MSIVESSIILPGPVAKKANDSHHVSAMDAASEQPDMSFDQQLLAEIEKNVDGILGIDLEEPAVLESQELPVLEFQQPKSLLEISDTALLDEAVAEDETLAETNILLSGNDLPMQDLVDTVPMAELESARSLTANPVALNTVGMNPQLVASKSSSTPTTSSRVEAAINSGTVEPDVIDPNVLGLNTEEVPDETFNNMSKNQSPQMETQITTKQEGGEFVKVIRSVSLPPVSVSATADLSARVSSETITQEFQISTPVNQKQWGQELTQRLSMMVTNGQQQVAELRLNPAHLGPLNVRITIEDDQANISFLANNQLVKEAVEVSMPRLREQLQEQGLDLAHVDVSARDNEDTDTSSMSDRADGGSGNELLDQEEQPQEMQITAEISDGVSIFV